VGYSVCGRYEVLCLPGTEYLYSDLLFIFLRVYRQMPRSFGHRAFQTQNSNNSYCVSQSSPTDKVSLSHLDTCINSKGFSNYLGRQTAEESSIISAFKTCTTLSSRNNVRTTEKMRTMLA